MKSRFQRMVRVSLMLTLSMAANADRSEARQTAGGRTCICRWFWQISGKQSRLRRKTESALGQRLPE